MNRREFARSLTAFACIGTGAGAAFAGLTENVPASHFVRDSRLGSHDIAEWLVRLKPTHHHVFDRDVTVVWREVLNEAWRESRTVTAGFTRHAEFFVLSTLAREQGYRVAATHEHAQYLSWMLVHAGAAPADWHAWNPAPT